jgi:hypothetical protein
MLASVATAAFGGVPVSSSAQERAIVITTPPPAVREERIPGPRHGYAWAPGHWAWRHGQYVWVSGHWIRERRGEHWVADRWIERNGRWELVAGHWERGNRVMGGPGMRDRDNDGVPNRYDAHPDNPYRR